MAAKKKVAKKKAAGGGGKQKGCDPKKVCKWLDMVAPNVPIVTPGPVNDTGEPILTQWDSALRLMWEAIRRLERQAYCPPATPKAPMIADCTGAGGGDKTPPPPPPNYPP